MATLPPEAYNDEEPSNVVPLSAARVPPHDLDAEAAVLSGVLLEQRAIDAVATLKPEHYFSESNRRIFEAAVWLAKNGQPIDVITVAARLRETQRLDHIGGASYLARLVDGTPAVANIRAHAEIVRDRSQLRQLIAHCHKIAARGYAHKGAAKELVDEASRGMFDIARTPEERAMVPIGPAVWQAVTDVTEAAKRGEAITGIATGFERLDGLTAGLHPGELTIVAARPGVGKTALVLNIAENIAGMSLTPRAEVDVFSLEMPREHLAARMLCSRAGVSLSKWRQPTMLDQGDWQRLTLAAQELDTLPVWIDDTSGIGLLELRAKVRERFAEAEQTGANVRLVIVDYLQLMTGESSHGREQEISGLSRGLKALAKDLRVPVIALAQLNRKVEDRGKDKIPQLSDLRESGSIEQDADNIIFIYRPDYYDRSSTEKGLAQLRIAKQRNGPVRNCWVKWSEYCTRFANLAAHEYPNDQEDEVA